MNKKNGFTLGFLNSLSYCLWNRKIKKSREGFEQKIAQSTRTIKDFVDYIKYERSLLGIIKERMKQNNIAVTSDHALIQIVSDHMKELYTQALSIFTQNIRFWDEYIKFLQTFKNKEDISSAFDRMLVVCSSLNVIFVPNFCEKK